MSKSKQEAEEEFRLLNEKLNSPEEDARINALVLAEIAPKLEANRKHQVRPRSPLIVETPTLLRRLNPERAAEADRGTYPRIINVPSLTSGQAVLVTVTIPQRGDPEP